MKNLLLLITCYILSTLSVSAQKEIWGMTSEGGINNAGVIFKTDGSGDNYKMEHTMFRYDGDYPKADLVKSSYDGKLYGITSACCVYDGESMLFQYDPGTATFVKKYTFHRAPDGTKCFGSLMEASDGKLYGMTSVGGLHNEGVIFQYDPITSTYTKKFDFDSIYGSDAEGTFVQAADGKLYAMTLKGGAHNYGVLIKYDPSTNAVSKILDFDGKNNGSGPYGALLDINNVLYGMTSHGGANDKGVIFKYDIGSATYTKIFDFDGAITGSSPEGVLAKAPDGILYGMTTFGGATNNGVLFQFDPTTNTYTKKHDFGSADDGIYPWGSLFLAADGHFYGMTHDGGADGVGVIFQYDISTSGYTKKYDFTLATGGNPSGTFIQDQNGIFYAMTNRGGQVNVGVVFQFNPSNSQYRTNIDFHTSPTGSFPIGSLMQATDGFLYGTTRNGGAFEDGVLFQYDRKAGTYTKEFEFKDTISGKFPSGSLVQATDGKLYGTTIQGGVNDMGILYQYDPIANTFKKILDFDGTNGGNPWGALYKAANGKLYGMTQNGGANGLGVIFMYDPSSTAYTNIYSFDGTKGKMPKGSLIQSKDGALYGMTNQGGVNNHGVLFKYDLSASTYTDLMDFKDTITGYFPTGSLIQGVSDDILYGMADQGGVNGVGVLFEYNIATSQFNKKIDFNNTNGSLPNGDLLLASDGKLYGMTPVGGKNGYGVLFQYDPVNASITTKYDFDNMNGRDPSRINLIEVESTNSISEQHTFVKEMHISPNPSNGNITIKLNQKVKDASLKLFTVTGQMVLTMDNFSGDKLSMDISAQAKGVYFLEVSDHGTVFRAKVTKN